VAGLKRPPGKFKVFDDTVPSEKLPLVVGGNEKKKLSFPVQYHAATFAQAIHFLDCPIRKSGVSPCKMKSSSKD